MSIQSKALYHLLEVVVAAAAARAAWEAGGCVGGGGGGYFLTIFGTRFKPVIIFKITSAILTVLAHHGLLVLENWLIF